MALCEQCGSINLVRTQPGFSDRVVTLFTSKRPFVCRRCRWRGRRDWSDEDLRALMNYGAGGAVLDPSLAVLDVEPQVAAKTGARKSQPRKSAGEADTRPEGLDLAALDLAALDPASGPPRRGRHRKRRNRQKRSRRREVVATIAATALVVFIVVLLGLTGSCSGGSDVL